MTLKRISDEAAAMADLAAPASRPAWRESRRFLPFHELSPDEFEILSFRLLLKEHPGDVIYYYGKTGDGGRDIIHIRGGWTLLIQCKRYADRVGIGELRIELAKLCANTFYDRLPDKPDEVIFYIAPDVTAPAADLIREQVRWRREAPKALREHLGADPAKDLLRFAKVWWPEPTYVAALALTERMEKFSGLRDEFFGVRKVIDAGLEDMQSAIRAEIQPIKDLMTSIGPGSERSTPGHRDTVPTDLEEAEILAVFGEVSQVLLSWPTTLPGGYWLPREEMTEFARRLDTETSSTTLLLGSPGSGKSALLARMGNAFRADGVAVLAMKADRLAVSVDSLGSLSEHLHLPAHIVECVQALAASRKVVVLIDQLDALADLVDVQSSRLSVLLALIKRLSNQANVHVLCSCRRFEHQHDIRLTSIDAVVAELALPTWEQVEETLRARQIDAVNWPPEFRELLRTPQHLSVFLQRFRGPAEDQIFTTYQQLLDDLWSRRVSHGDRGAEKSQLLMDLASQVAERETHWLPAVRFEDREDLVRALESEGILARAETGLSIGFRHQTLFEHARARAFARNSGSLAEHVLRRQDGLFIRPLLWSSLNYLRGSDPAGYHFEMSRLWSEPVRKHIRHLLIDFLGQISVPEPTDSERLWLVEYLHKVAYRSKVLTAIRGNGAWFRLLATAHLPVIMRLPEAEAWPMVTVLSSAWVVDRARCLHLVEAEWLPDRSKDALTWRVLQLLNQWDEDSMRIVTQILARSDFSGPDVMLMVARVAENAPHLAVRLVRAKLLRDLEACEAQIDPPPPEISPDASEEDRLVSRFTYRPKRRFGDLLDQSRDLHDLVVLAEDVPEEVLAEIWPWFVRVIEHLTEDRESEVTQYRQAESLSTRLPRQEGSGDRDRDFSITAALDIAVRRVAERRPEGFLAFMDMEKARDSMIVQRILSRGLTAIAALHPRAGLRFLTEDPRRLALGNYEGEHADTTALISALVPHLSEPECHEIEEAILSLKFRQPRDCSEYEASTRFKMAKWERVHRLQLLAAFPADRLSSKAQSLVRAEITALPHFSTSRDSPIEGGLVVSPMSALQMAKAKDDDILRLFVVISQEEPHSKGILRGGTIEASRALAEFAKLPPERAASIIRRFEPFRDEIPAGHALEGIAHTHYPVEGIFPLILELDQRGFFSADFRVSAARTLGICAKQDVGLPDSMISLLERWLADPWAPTEALGRENRPPDNDRPRSVLWSHPEMSPIPFGTYTLLEAITYGLLLRKPPDAERWLAFLEAHSERPESIETWRAFLHNLRHLSLCDPVRSVRFIERLLDRFKQLSDTTAWAAVLTHIWSFLPSDVLWRFLHAIRDGSWPDGPQAFGELVSLRYLAWSEDREAQAAVKSLLAPDDHRDELIPIRAGLAFTAAHMWSSPSHRSRATDLLANVVAVAESRIAHAVMSIFSTANALVADRDTHRLLQAILECAATMRSADSSYFAERLEDVLTAFPDLVFELCSAVVRLRSQDLTSAPVGFLRNTAHLTNMALTFQRLGGHYRSMGLELFESLLDIGVREAQDALQEIDKRPLRNMSPSARSLRRRPKAST